MDPHSGLVVSFWNTNAQSVPRRIRPLRVVLPNREWIDVRKFGVVKTTFPLAGSDERLLLLFWGLSVEPRFENLVRVDRHGNVLWRAELPGDAPRDCFVGLEQRIDGFVARTFSGRTVRLDEQGQASRSERPIEERVLIES